MTVFRVDQWGDEIDRLLENPFIPVEDLEVDVEEDEVIDDLVSKALVMIEDKVDKLDPWQMQELEGGLLQSMEYNVHISPKGPDGGIDVLAIKMHLDLKSILLKYR